MQGKKRYLALILFLIIGLVTFSFANPNDELEPVEENVKKVSDNSNNEVDKSKAEQAVEEAELRPSEETVEEAEEIIEESVTNTQVRQELTQRLEIVEEAIDASELVATVERMVEESENRDDILASEYYFDTNDIEKITGNMDPGDVKDNLQDRIDNLNDIFDDETAPTIKGIENGETTKNNVKITIEDTNEVTTTVTLNNDKIDFADEFNKEGVYEINVVDAAHHASSITFTIDKTKPKFEGLASREVDIEYYKVDVTDATEVKLYLSKNNSAFEEIQEGYELTEEATYQLKAEDAAGNVYTTWIHIDKTYPTIDGIEDHENVNYCVSISAFDRYLDTVEIDGTKYTRKGVIPFEHNSSNENFKFVYPVQICEEGTHTIIARDKSGKETVKEFTIDTTPNRVTQTSLSTKVAEGKTYYAINGSTIEFSIGFRELLREDAKVTIGGKEVALTYDKFYKAINTHLYRGTLTIAEDELEMKEGELEIVITSITDQTGNKGFYYQTNGKKVITEYKNVLTTNGRKVIYDRTPNRVNETSLATSVVDGKTYYVKNGGTIEFSIGFRELLGEDAKVTIGGKEVALTYDKFYKDTNTHLYRGKLTIAEDESEMIEGELEIAITNITDKAGNKVFYYKTNGTKLVETYKNTITTNGRKVIYDRTPNRLKETSISGGTTEGKNHYITNGDTITYYARFSEPLEGKAVLTIGGREVELTYDKYFEEQKNYQYSATFTIPSDESSLTEGILDFYITNITDKVGHKKFYYKNTNYLYENLSQTETTNGRKLFYTLPDKEAPTISLLGEENILLALGETYVEPGVKVVDNIDGESTLTNPTKIELYNINDQLIGTVDSVDTAITGKYVLTYQTKDAAGNVSNTIQRTVSIYANVIRTAEDLKELFSSFDNIKNKVVILQKNIDMSNVTDWKPVMGVDTYSFTFEGNGHKISNLVYETDKKYAGLFFEGMDSGDVTIKNLTIEGSKVTSTASGSYVGLIGGYIDVINSVNLNKVNIINSEVNSTNYAGAFLGWTAGYNTQNDGPVDGIINIIDCTVKGTKVFGGGSAGLATGHAGSNPGTYTTIKNFVAEDNTIKGEKAEKTGAVIGTANSGEVVLDNIEYKNNTVFDLENSTKLVGRFVPNSTGKLTHIVDDETEYIDAVNNALNGQVIKLGKDLDFMDQTTTIAKDKVLILDLNGKTIDGKSTKGETSSLFTVKNNASLTIKGEGIITYEAGKPDTDWGGEGQREFPGYANNTIRNEGKLIIDKASIFNTTPSGGATFVIDNYPGADLIVEDGIIQQVGGATAIRMFANSATLNTKVTINGGKISGAAAVWLQLPSENTAVAPKAELIITGGTFSSVKSSDAVYSYSYGNSHANTSVTITGGTFNNGVQFGYNAKNFYDDLKTLSITGGTFNSYVGKWTANHNWIDIEV